MFRCILILLIALLSACASSPRQVEPMYRPLPAEARNALRGVDVLIGVKPMEIDTGKARAAPDKPFNDVTGGVRMGNGDPRGELIVILTIALIAGAVILVERGSEAGSEAWQRYMAGRAVAPVERSLGELDFGAQLRAALMREDGPELALKRGEVSIVSPATPANFDAYHAMSAQDAVLVVQLNYAMSPDLNTLTLKADASLLPRSDTMWQMQQRLFRTGQRTDKLPGPQIIDPRHTLYHRVMHVTQTLPVKSDDRDKAAAAWTLDQGAPLRGALLEGLGVVAKVLASDMGSKPAAGSIEVDGKRFLMSTGADDITRLYAPR